MIAEIEKYVDKIQKKVFISVTTPHHIVNSTSNWTSTKICSYSCITIVQMRNVIMQYFSLHSLHLLSQKNKNKSSSVLIEPI